MAFCPFFTSFSWPSYVMRAKWISIDHEAFVLAEATGCGRLVQAGLCNRLLSLLLSGEQSMTIQRETASMASRAIRMVIMLVQSKRS